MVKKNFLLTFFLVYVFSFLPATVSADESYDLLLDASGSMKGFTKEKNSWSNFMEAFESGAQKKCLFGDTYRCIGGGLSLKQQRLNDENTRLGEHVQKWIGLSSKGDKLVIVTDNVADTGSAQGSLRSQTQMAALLSSKDSPFTHITLIATRLLFKGTLYDLDNNKTQYAGERALVIYILGREGIDDEQYRNLRLEIERKLGARDRKLQQTKPFSTDDALRQGKIQLNLTKSNGYVKLRPYERDGVMGMQVQGYTLGEPLKFKFDSDVTIQGAYKLENIKMKAELKFAELPDHIKVVGKSDRRPLFEGSVMPAEMNLTPDKIEDFNISFEIGKLSFDDLSFKKKLQYALTNKITHEGRLTLTFEASKENYREDPKTFDNWSFTDKKLLNSPDENIQRKVYNLEQIFKEAVPDSHVKSTLQRYPFRLEVRYSMGPLISGLILLLLFGGLLFWAWKKMQEDQEHILEDDMGAKTPLAIDFGQKYKHYDEAYQNWFNMTYWGVGYWIGTPYKLVGPRFINAGQHFSILDPDTNEEYTWYLQKRENTDDYMGDDDHDDYQL